MIRVLVVDDHRLVRQGIQLLLEKAEDIRVVGEARDGREAVELTAKLNPHVVLMDADMPHMDGISATEMIRSLDLGTHVIILSMYSDDALQEKAQQSGADAYIQKRGDRDELIAAIRAVCQGQPFHPPSSNSSGPF